MGGQFLPFYLPQGSGCGLNGRGVVAFDGCLQSLVGGPFTRTGVLTGGGFCGEEGGRLLFLSRTEREQSGIPLNLVLGHACRGRRGVRWGLRWGLPLGHRKE